MAYIPEKIIVNVGGGVGYRKNGRLMRGSDGKGTEYINDFRSAIVLDGCSSRGYHRRHKEWFQIRDSRGFECLVGIDGITPWLVSGMANFKYGFDDIGDIVMLPCDCPEYVASIAETDVEGKVGSFGLRDLVVGKTYTTKEGDSLLFIGRHHWHHPVMTDLKKDASGVYRNRPVFWRAKRFDYRRNFGFTGLGSVKSLVSESSEVSGVDELVNGFITGKNGSAVASVSECTVNESEHYQRHYIKEGDSYVSYCKRGYKSGTYTLDGDVLRYVSHPISPYFQDPVSVAGGVGLNVVLNNGLIVKIEEYIR